MTPLRVCTQCGFTHAEFLARGLLGCPECYANFGDALFADLLHLHPDLHRRPDAATGDPLREQFSEALRLERYEEAAALRQRLRDLGLTP
jgi:protein arginine kinase activator